MERESFEDQEIAGILNTHFVSVKVDRELRPDIDSIYMSVCQLMTGSGGWPLSIFLTPSQKPFFAGTYFPPGTRNGQMGFRELLTAISGKWQEDSQTVSDSAEELLKYLHSEENEDNNETAREDLLEEAIAIYQHSFDERYGGFGHAPKFPAAHNLLFLLSCFEAAFDFFIPESQCPESQIPHSLPRFKFAAGYLTLKMAEKTLTQMYKGGIFDHIGGGFSRYSTDSRFLVPHFEKMLYDNALLMMAYAQAYRITGKEVYRQAAEGTASFILGEMTDKKGGFYSAQDADSQGEEGKYYTFSYEEILQVLGKEEGEKYNHFYGISRNGNFEGKNIPNLLHHEKEEKVREFAQANQKLYEYRKQRMALAMDDKILTAWNGLMIGSLAVMYQVFGKESYLMAAVRAWDFMEKGLTAGDDLYVGYRDGKPMVKGFLDDYACCIFALIRLYDATLQKRFLVRAEELWNRVYEEFADQEGGGFFLSGCKNETLIHRPKETYDGAIPSGNSLMAYNLTRLSQLCGSSDMAKEAEKQMEFMKRKASEYPTGHGFFLLSCLGKVYPPEHVVCVIKDRSDIRELTQKAGLHSNIILYEHPTKEYPLLHDSTTYYICKGFSCLPPRNEYPGP